MGKFSPMWKKLYDWGDSGYADVAGPYKFGAINYFIVLKVDYLDEGAVVRNGKDMPYLVDVCIVSPSAMRHVGREAEIERAMQSCGFDEIMMEGLRVTREELELEALVTYGNTATVHEETGSNIKDLLREARRQARQYTDPDSFESLMYDTANLIGASHWDFLVGDPTGPVFGRMRSAEDFETQEDDA